MKPPDFFAPKTLEEKVSQWPDWSFSFRVHLGFIDPIYAAEFRRIETATVPINSSGYSADEAARSVKLYAILASYLRNRPLKLLKSESDQDGYKVWQRLFQELEPSSRTRGFAMAQALVSFPAMTKGISILDYLLTYEKFVSEYDKISQLAYDENLKIGTVLKGLPNELRKHILVGLRPDTKYEEIRTKLLEHERSTQSWNAENILQSSSMDSMYKSSSNNSTYQGPQPMEIDRINGKSQDKGKGKGKAKGKAKGKGKGKFGKGGKGQDVYPFGKGRGRGSDHKGRGRDGKGRGRSSFIAKGARAVGEYGYGKSEGKGKDSKGKSKFEGTCYNCGKTGHKASECYQRNVRSVDEIQEDWNAATASSSQQTPQGSTTRIVTAEAAPRTRKITDVVEEDEEINFLHLSREFDELMRGASLRCIWIDLSDGENEDHVSPDAVFSWMKSDVEFYGTSTQKEFDLTLGDELEDFVKSSRIFPL